MRQSLMPIAVAVSTFSVVTGAIVAVGLITATPVDAQLSAGLTGDWKGGYVSNAGNDVNTFDAKLVQAGRTVSGTVTETNAFGDQALALFLTSRVEGSIEGRSVNLTKTYDGSGGVSHSVMYTGQIDASGRRIRGTYTTSGTPEGAFEMVR